MSSIDGGDIENLCATEPNDGDLSPFELPDDSNDELLTVNLSPASKIRKKSKSFRVENSQQLLN